KAEEIHDLETAVAPGAGEADGPSDGGIVAGGVGGGWVEHAEPDGRPVRPAAPEPVAMAPVLREGRAGGHAAARCRARATGGGDVAPRRPASPARHPSP